MITKKQIATICEELLGLKVEIEENYNYSYDFLVVIPTRKVEPYAIGFGIRVLASHSSDSCRALLRTKVKDEYLKCPVCDKEFHAYKDNDGYWERHLCKLSRF